MAIGKLIEDGCVVGFDKVKARAGRKPTLLKSNEEIS